MSPAVLSLILWIPFLITVLVAGILFCRSGYRKGVWRALIAFGATLAAAVLSLLLAGLLSGLLAPAITGRIPADSFGEDPITARLTLLLVSTVIRSTLSLVLFWLLMLILTVVLRLISARIQKDKLIATEKPMRWLGLGVGLLSALTFALLWLCPLYSSLAVFTPIVDHALASNEDPASGLSESRAYLQAVQANPVVAVSGSAPMELVYNSAASVSVGSAAVPVSDAAAAMEECMDLANQIAVSEDEAVMAEKSSELVALLRKNVVNQKWFHSMSMVLVKEASAAAGNMTGQDAAFLRQLIAVFDLPQDVFAGNCDELLGFFDYALANDIIAILETADWDRLYSAGILQQAGELANCTDEAVALKRLLVTAAITSGVCEGDMEAAQTFLKNYPIEKVTDPQLQLREAEAIMQLIIQDSACPAEFVLRYPALGEKAMESLRSEADLVVFSGMTVEKQTELMALTQADPALADALYAQALHCAEVPIGSASFRNSCRLLLEITKYADTWSFEYYEEYDPDSLRFALDTVGADAFILHPAGKKMYVILSLYPELLEADPALGESSLSSGIMGLNGLAYAAVKHTILSDPKNQNTIDLSSCVQMYAANELTVAAVKKYVDTYGADSLQLGSRLSDAEKDALRTLIDECSQRLTMDPEMAGTLSSSSSVPIQEVENMTIVVSGETGFTDPQQVAEHNQSIAEALTYLKQLFDL